MAKKKPNQIICRCGHLEKDHIDLDTFLGVEIVCSFKNNKIFCLCSSYRPDNLKHVEILAKKKGLV